jgi:hypothetical protein
MSFCEAGVIVRHIRRLHFEAHDSPTLGGNAGDLAEQPAHLEPEVRQKIRDAAGGGAIALGTAPDSRACSVDSIDEEARLIGQQRACQRARKNDGPHHTWPSASVVKVPFVAVTFFSLRTGTTCDPSPAQHHSSLGRAAEIAERGLRRHASGHQPNCS